MVVKIGPILTYASCITCVAIFLTTSAGEGARSWEQLSSVGYFPASAIWDGAYWALWRTVFVHLSFWHLGFNLWWLWVLGSTVEQKVRRVLWLTLFVMAAAISSSAQLAASGDTGVGASGVVYGFFGFVLVTRRNFPEFEQLASKSNVTLLIAWLALGIPMTYFGILSVGNAAHVAGLVAGSLVGLAVYARRHKAAYRLALAVLILSSLIPLFWAPWSVDWMGLQAYRAHSEGEYERAVEWYTAILEHDPINAWALYNRGVAFENLGMQPEADRDIGLAMHLDPNIAAPTQ